MPIVPIKINGRSIKPHKCIVDPTLSSRTVLTTSPWEFVELWLKRKRQAKALFFWNQAREFAKAASDLSIYSSPLLHYYSFMNAAKALLASKNISFNPYHGVTEYSISSSQISLRSIGVKIKNQGIVPSLSSYLNETESSRTHTLQEIFFNLPYIHRTYCLTYPSQRDMFIPLKECEYVQDSTSKQVFFRAKLSADFSSQHVLKILPPSLTFLSKNEKGYYIRSVTTIQYSRPSRPVSADVQRLINLNTSIRKDIFYINGTQTLWYVKANIKSGPTKITRYPMTLTLAAMHRLSELCRYKPFELSSILDGQKNWLLSEFIQQSPGQFRMK
jgi:hypothetical protein